MPLVLLPMLESDIPDFVRTERLAFADSLNRYLLPNPTHSAEQITASINRRRDAFINERRTRFFKVVDDALTPPRAIAFSKWGEYATERTPEELAQNTTVPPAPPGANVPLWDAFFAFLRRSRGKWMGRRPHMFLHVLITEPAHQRRGAGAMLLEWGVRRADELGLECYLEASPEGKGLYERYGFVLREEDVIPLEEYGHEGESVTTVMIRPVKGVVGGGGGEGDGEGEGRRED